MTLANMADYWPAPGANEQLLVQDATVAYGPEVLSVLWRYKRGPVVGGIQTQQIDNYSTDGWLAQWEMKNDPTFGRLEFADKAVGSRSVYTVGNEIKWGGTVNVSDNIEGSVIVNPAASTNVGTGYWNYGYNRLTIEECISDFTNDGGLSFSGVLKVKLFQAFCNNSTCNYPAGVKIWENRYWLAPEIGIVQTDYLANQQGAIRRDYAKTITRTVLMP